jgi:starch synthase (maltosyl-transferring)
VNRVVGEAIDVQADIFRDGHDVLTAVLKYRVWNNPGWAEVPMRCVNPGLDRWEGRFCPEQVTTYRYTIEAWVDVFQTWRQELQKKFEAGQDVASELLEGIWFIRQAAERATEADQQALGQAAHYIATRPNQQEQVRNALAESLARLMAKYPDRGTATLAEPEMELVVDPITPASGKRPKARDVPRHHPAAAGAQGHGV